MAVVVSIAGGHDAAYPFKTSGTVDGSVIIGERGARYYLSAVEKGGEAGTWEYEKKRWHAPGQRALATMRRFANAMTRRCKVSARWASRGCCASGSRTRTTPVLGCRATLHEPSGTQPSEEAQTRAELARMTARLASRGELTRTQEGAAMAAGLAQAQESRTARSRADLPHCGGKHPSNEPETAPYVSAEGEAVIAERLVDSGADLGPTEGQISSWHEANRRWNQSDRLRGREGGGGVTWLCLRAPAGPS
jgi:hypothetical protein